MGDAYDDMDAGRRPDLLAEYQARRDAAVQALGLLGSAWRGDWNDFDGRTLRDQLDEIATMLTGSEPMTVKRFCDSNGICPRYGHWTTYCTDDCREEETSDG